MDSKTMDSSKKILVVEDDPAIRTLICRFLTAKQNYQIQSAEDGKNALSLFKQFDPDLVILDINLPDINGSQLRQAMQESTNVCVLMLTSQNDQGSRLKMLSQGADDYMTKPFDLEELAVRVEVILRRIRDRKSPKQKVLSFGNLTIDPERHEAKLYDSLIDLTALEFKLLYFLASNPGKVWTRADLIREVWEHDFVGDPRVVDVHIGQIRKKVEIDTSQPMMIHTIRGVGYKFEAIEKAPAESSP
jgi:DNA-binding response OmpR family regulator